MNKNAEPAPIARPAPAGRQRVVAILCDHFVFTSSVYALLEDLEQIGDSDAHAARFGWRAPRCRCVLVNSKATVIPGAGNVKLQVEACLESVAQADAVIVPAYVAPPAGWDGALGQPHFRPEMIAWLQRQYAQGALVCGVLSGAYALAEAGLLDGELATTHWIERPAMAQLYPEIMVDPQRTLCVGGQDGRIVTIGSNGAYHNDVVEYLAARLFGSEVVGTLDGMRGAMRTPPALDAQASLEARANCTDSQVRAAQDWLAVNFASASPVRGVCDELGIADRTLSRRFRATTGMTLLAYVQALRIVNSQRLLERSNDAIEDVAASVGYNDVASFRRQFRRRVGMNPDRYRRAITAGETK